MVHSRLVGNHARESGRLPFPSPRGRGTRRRSVTCAKYDAAKLSISGHRTDNVADITDGALLVVSSSPPRLTSKTDDVKCAGEIYAFMPVSYI
jgi:hypothetical protein